MTHQTVSSRQLSRVIRQVIDHAGTDERSDLAHVWLESDGTHLFAVATDRLTLAVAREKLDHDLNPDARPFSILLYPRDAAHLAKIADGDEAFDDGLSFSAPPDFYTRLLVSDGRPPIVAAQVLYRKDGADEYDDDACAKFVPAPDVIPYDWRELVRGCLAKAASSPASEMAFNPALLARWQGSDCRPLHFRFAGAYDAVIVTGHEFLGVQLPVKPLNSDESFAEYVSRWTADLAPKGVSVDG